MVISRLSVSVSGFGVGVGLAHTTLVVVSGGSGMFQDVSGSVVNGHDCHPVGGELQTDINYGLSVSGFYF